MSAKLEKRKKRGLKSSGPSQYLNLVPMSTFGGGVVFLGAGEYFTIRRFQLLMMPHHIPLISIMNDDYEEYEDNPECA